MNLKRGYAERGDDVVITMTRADFDTVILALATRAGYARMDGDKTGSREILAVANRLNEGNKCWTPYAEGA